LNPRSTTRRIGKVKINTGVGLTLSMINECLRGRHEAYNKVRKKGSEALQIWPLRSGA